MRVENVNRPLVVCAVQGDFGDLRRTSRTTHFDPDDAENSETSCTSFAIIHAIPTKFQQYTVTILLYFSRLKYFMQE